MTPSANILIIDDEPLFRLNLRALLEDLGYQVEEASNGPQGLELCARQRPDLVLLDVRMPHMDGFEVCTRLKAEESLRAIPVVFLSGLLDAQEKVKAFQAGGVDYITKPFRIEEVEARVRTHMELVRQRERLERQNEELQRSLDEMALLNRKLIEMNEKLRESEELKGQFLSNMRNEINNPLSTILAFGVDLERGTVPPERSPSVGSLIAAEASGLDFQLRNVFCAAELEAGEATPSITRVDAGSVIHDVLDSLRHAAGQRSIRFELEIPEPGRSWFRTDAEKLRIIAANLISNAVKFSPDAGTVRIQLQVDEEALRLSVKDEGIGIRPQDQALIFERFRQLENGVSRAHMGQGLGLSVVKALLDLLEGSISVSSVPGEGALFTCSWPAGTRSDAASTLSVDGNLFFFEEDEEN